MTKGRRKMKYQFKVFLCEPLLFSLLTSANVFFSERI